MPLTLPITGISNAFDCLLLILAWAVVSHRMKQSKFRVSETVEYIRKYFWYFAIFNAFMALPALLIFFQPSLFPAAMAWGYVIANVFLLISLSFLSRMEVRIIPQWTGRERLVLYAWIVLTVVMTILNIVFVALQNQPTFDTATGITQFHFPAFLGPILGMISLAAYLPGIALFIISAVNEGGDKRVRSILLAAGMAIIMVAGPLHAAAGSWQVFLLADMLNVVSLILLAAGVLYRLAPAEDEMPPERPTQAVS